MTISLPLIGVTGSTWISCDDLAEAAVAVLTTGGHDGTSYDVTGPRR